ncbi:MAG: hypothetical protein H7A51_14615 [Akkermansiaceae bacterium]|nr:hypothetical protein [Akkermansiaceae bacterium]
MRFQPFQLLIAFALILGAQTQGQSPAKPGNARVRFVSLARMPLKEYSILQGKDKTAVKTAVSISDWNISPPVRLATDIPCKLPNESGEGNLASFRLLPGPREQLVVLTPAAKDAAGEYTVTVLDISPAKFMGGERYAINLSLLPVVVRFGDTNTRIESGAIGKIKTPRGKDGDFLPVHAAFYNDKRSKLFMSSRWVRDSRARTLLFIYPDADKKSLSWHGLEVPPLAEKEDVPEP